RADCHASRLDTAELVRMLRIFHACRHTRHELLLALGGDDTAAAIERLYGHGVRPDWWGVRPSDDPAALSAVERAVVSHDPYCLGVLLLGASTPEALAAARRASAGLGVV